MSYRRRAIQAAEKVPGLGQYIRLKRTAMRADQQAAAMNATIKQLEARNEEWAAEVRELRNENKPQSIVWPVYPDDVKTAQWIKNKAPKTNQKKKSSPPFVFNWVLPPMGESSGGHTTIFRIIQFLESKGHHCRVYFYDPLNTNTLRSLTENLKHYPSITADLFYNEKAMQEADGIFATSWHTAYPVFNAKTDAKKFYFVQDFEPFFDPVGAYSTLAENTYHFGLHAITIGSWLAEKLSTEYGMECDPFEFGVNASEYKLLSPKPRKKILFYARPVTPRRGFELGVLALEIFHKKHPEYEINFLGWDMKRYEIPFDFVNNGILATDELNALYNECAAGLVLSFTNMSLLPLEMMAAGCVPIINESKHTRMVGYADSLEYAIPTPQALADKLHEVVTSQNLAKKAEELATASKNYQWGGSYDKIEDAIKRQISQ